MPSTPRLRVRTSTNSAISSSGIIHQKNTITVMATVAMPDSISSEAFHAFAAISPGSQALASSGLANCPANISGLRVMLIDDRSARVPRKLRRPWMRSSGPWRVHG